MAVRWKQQKTSFAPFYPNYPKKKKNTETYLGRHHVPTTLQTKTATNIPNV